MTLTARNLSFGYGRRTVGIGIDLTLASGEVLCLLGPNGAGKTTLFKTLLGLITPSRGQIKINGKPLDHWSARERARLIAYVPQAHAALFPFSVRDLVLMGRAAHIGLFSTPSPADHERADSLLKQFGLLHLADRPYTEISGGERQIALIARALAQQPQILVMDEPTASLDYGNQLRVIHHVRTLARQGIAVVLSTHNPDHAFLCADTIALFHERTIIAQGSPETVLTPERIKTLYGVETVIGSVSGSTARLCAPVLESR